MKQLSEFTEDLVHRINRVYALLREGQSLDEAICIAFCIDIEESQHFTGRMFAELYAELMAYDRDTHHM